MESLPNISRQMQFQSTLIAIKSIHSHKGSKVLVNTCPPSICGTVSLRLGYSESVWPPPVEYVDHSLSLYELHVRKPPRKVNLMQVATQKFPGYFITFPLVFFFHCERLCPGRCMREAYRNWYLKNRLLLQYYAALFRLCCFSLYFTIITPRLERIPCRAM